MKILRKFLADTPRRIMLFVALVINGMALGQTQINGNVNPSTFTTSNGQTKNFILTEDVFFSGGNSISVAGNLTIDLNGHVMQNPNHYNYMVVVNSGGTFTLKDSNPTVEHYGKPETIIPAGTTFNLPYLWNYKTSYNASTPGAIEIDGGILTGGMGTMAGCVSVQTGGTFNLQGGTIAGCFIYLNGGIFTTADVDAAYTNSANFDSNGCFTQGGVGGAVYVYPNGHFNMTGGRICYNFAALAGGGVHTSSPYFIMSGGQIDHNQVSGSEHSYGGGVYVSHSAHHNPTQEFNGSFTMSGGSINNNSAHRGGGVFVSGAGTMTMSNDADVSNNTTTQFGGGIELEGTDATNIARLVMNGGSISNNTANSGGGVMEYGYSLFNMNGGVISGNNAFNTGGNGNGGAVYVQDATFNLNAGTLENNTATRYGGGVNINQGSTFTIGASGNVLIKGNQAGFGGGIVTEVGSNLSLNQNVTIEENTATFNGGGIMVEQGTVTMAGAKIRNNTAGNNGGGIDLAISRLAGTISFTMTGGEITGNRAGTSSQTDNLPGSHGTMEWDRSGGGISITANNATTSNSVTVNLRGGVISDNHLGDYGNDGGGVYVNVTTGSGTITLTNSIQIENNTAKRNGGGIYFGNNTTMQVGAGTMTVKDNTVNSIPNNIYLSTGKTIAVTGAFDPQYVGIYTQATSTPIKVFTGTKALLNPVYNGMVDGSKNIFDDKQLYSALYPYNSDYSIYFSNGSPWSPLQQKVTEDDLSLVNGVYQIGNVKQLTAFLWLVNNIDTHANLDANAQPTAKGKLTADIDMTGHYWVPIGEVNASWSNSPYSGTFDGNGHTITGITMVPTNVSKERGLFGVNASGTIKNVNLRDCYFAGGGSYIGSIVSQMNGGTLYNSVAQCQLLATATTTKAGGLVGHINGGEVHSSVSTCEMTGYTMGGLVGQLSSGNLYNSYAYTKFDHKGGSTYFGGLAAENTGTIENCYVRLQGSAPSGNFGWLVGNNTGGTINYSYSPNATYTVSGQGGTQNGLSTFGVTATNAYNYRVRDNQVAATNAYAPTYDEHHLADYQLKKYLNKWVDTKNGGSSTYAGWTRPTTQAINDDYPLLKLHGFNAVAATSGELTLDYGDINTLLTDYATADNSILFYGSKEGMDSNSGSAAPLYIDEDAVLTPSTAGDIVAHVGVTIDNSACHAGANPSFAAQGYTDYIDWHFFSSVLKDSPIGLHYGAAGSETEDIQQYQAYVYPSWNATFTNANGYFPLNLNDYYVDWDLYAYCEPDYHWINLKRNSASHWHEDYPGINIPYTNDTEFVPGKGYMVALKEDGYLQAYGTLNTNTGSGSDFIEVPLSYTSDISWTTRQGHNLLGNPYQSYLDFDLFAEYNKGLWGNDKTKAYYIIIDEDQKNYVEYAYGSSENPFGAGRYLHPHQGFMIIVSDSDMSAKFDNRMRNTTAAGVGFRDNDRPNYPLVNLMATDRNGNRDLVTVELGRPDKGGAPKQQALRTSSCSLWCRYEDEDYALVFTQLGLEYANIRFAADEDAEFTMTWSTHNGEFSYLHLIDNMTGADIDCLTASEYRFTSRTSDYNSRFRLVFDYTGIDDHEVPEPVEGPATFAYYANGEIHLTSTPDATAQLQIIDMTGRTIVSRDGVHTVSTTGLAAGVYVLRLTTANGTRIQKIVLN